jgi:hypothetical protein
MSKWIQVLIRLDGNTDKEYYEEWKRLVMLMGSTRQALLFLLKAVMRGKQSNG